MVVKGKTKMAEKNMDPKKCPMPVQEPDVRNKNFDEVALGYTYDMAINEARRCLNCKKSVEFTCNVKLGFKNNGEEFQIVLYNPYYLYNVLSTNLIKIYGSKIDLNDFRNLYQDFFWNCIMNFKLAGLSCDMLLKYNKLYKVKVEEVKEENINEKKKGKDKNKNDNKQKKFKDLSIVKNIIQFTS